MNWNTVELPSGDEYDAEIQALSDAAQLLGRGEGFMVAAGLVGMAYEIQRWSYYDELSKYLHAIGEGEVE